MCSLSEEDYQLFKHVQQEISSNALSLMEALWVNWSHMGIDHKTKRDRIKCLVQHEKEYHKDIKNESDQKLKMLQCEVNKLIEEAKVLGKYLSKDIPIQECPEDVYLIDYKKSLEEQISGYRREVELRKITIQRLREWQRDLCDALGVEERQIVEMPLPSKEELDEMKEHLDVLQKERDQRVAKFLNTQREVKDIMERLCIKPMMKFECLVVNSLSVDFKVTDQNMENLAELLQNLQEQMEETNNRVLELRERLNRLWECLEEDRMYRNNFLQANPGCGPATEKALREEISRCQHIKKQKIQVFIANIRTKIKLMWEQCMYGPEQRREFVCYYEDIFSEDTLTLHELYLEELTKIYNDHKKMYDLVMMRRELWEKMSELESRANEPGRFHNRGGQLLQEEKERKRIASKLPKIEEQLVEMVKQYEATGKSFLVDGKPLLEQITKDWESRKQERQNKVSARKQALTPNTPLLKSMALSPLGKRNRTAAGFTVMAEKNRPSKRPLVTASASKLQCNNNMSAVKRSAMSTVKRRISGRIAARIKAQDSAAAGPSRKLHYAEKKTTPRIVVNGSILKHKRKQSVGRRSSSSRRSLNHSKKTSSKTNSSISQDEEPKPKQVSDSTMLTTSYTDFKEHIDENTKSRSSLVVGKAPAKHIINHQAPIYEVTPKKTPAVKQKVFTPKLGKENVHKAETPKTPLTRATAKNNNDVFLTPRAPLSATKSNIMSSLTPNATKIPSRNNGLQRQNTMTPVATRTTPTSISRSQTSHVLRPKILPPLI